jgi:hypothetical protein
VLSREATIPPHGEFKENRSQSWVNQIYE